MNKPLHVALVEPFYTGSHQYWIDSLGQHLEATVSIYTLPGRHWKWRMTAGCIPLADKVNATNQEVDVFLVTDMLDVASFKALLKPQYQNVPIVLYMHENQVVYPFKTDKRDKNWDRHYGFINYKSLLVANQVWFNSSFHKEVFFDEMANFLKPFPESKTLVSSLSGIKERSKVIPLGLDIPLLNQYQQKPSSRPTVLWNHRWEHDKNPEVFFNTLIELSREGVAFDLIVCGEQYAQQPVVFKEAKKELHKHVIHWGYFDDRSDYIKALWKSTVLPVTSNQEFFGLSVMEAIHCGAHPLLPSRLAYADIYRDHDAFYDSDVDFKEKLKAILDNPQGFNIQWFTKQFDWKEVIKEYSQALTRVVS